MMEYMRKLHNWRGTNIYAGPIRSTAPGQLSQHIIIQDASNGYHSSHADGYSDSITANIYQLDSSAEYQVAARIFDANDVDSSRFTTTSLLSGISKDSDVNTSLKIAALDSNGNNVNLSFGSKTAGVCQYSTSNVTPDNYGRIKLTIAPGDSVCGHLVPEDDPFTNYTLNGVAIEIFVVKQTS